MYSKKTFIFSIGLALFIGIAAGAYSYNIYNQFRVLDNIYHQAWFDIGEVTPMCKAIRANRQNNVILMLEAKADGIILGLAPQITKTPDTQNKWDFIDEVRQYSVYRSSSVAPTEFPTRTKDVDDAIAVILQKHP